MAILKLIVFGCILAVTLAVSLEPILPTPAPSDSALRNETKENSVENEMTTLSPSVKPAILVVKESTDNATSSAKNDDNDIKQGRAMNISSTDAQSFSNSINNSSKGESKAKARHLALNPDLSDISMDGDDMDLEFSGNSPGKENSSKGNIFGETRVVNKPHIDASDKSFMPLLMPSISSEKDVIETSCIDSGKIYKVGESIQRGCEETCTCMPEGRLSCEARCRGPYFRRGRKIDDPLCAEKEVEDPCCSILVCAADTGNTMCVSGNKTYMAGENFNEGCERTCRCESGGNISCVPRCPVIEQRDDCFSVPNSNDSCCMLQLCDVSQDNEEDSNPSNRDAKQKNDLMSTVLETTTNKMSKENATTTLPVLPDVINTSKKPIINSSMTSGMIFIPISKDVEPILSTYRLSNGSVQVVLRQSDQPIQLEISNDEGATYKDIKLNNGMLTNLEGGHDYIVRSKQTKKEFHITIPKTDDAIQDGCMHRGKHRSIDEEFHMGCDELCVCGTNGKVKCATLQCPSTVGLDVLDPHCIKWSPDPPDFVPTYPMCCPPAMKCISNGSCTYKEHVLPNWSEVPKELSGCEQQCFCEQGMIECQSVCAPLTATPPPSLNCPPSTHPAPQLIHDDSCCKEWACVNAGLGSFPITQSGPSFGNGGNEELQVLVLEPVSPTEIRLVFSLPAVMVGLQGRVKLRYTDSNDPDEKYWKEQEFAPRNDLLASQQLEFQLGSLQPNTLYHIQATVVFIQFHYERKSRIYSVRTLPAQEQTTLPSTIPIEPNLAVGQVNPTSVQITWRPFTQDELLYIDGIQLRYREIDGKVFSGTPLIHRAVTSFLLESLKPNTSYEVGIYFIPFLGQHTELQSTNMYRFNTTPQTDMFDWNVSIEVDNITPWSLTIKWTGVPRPAERYVHVYRTIWRAEAARIDASSFSLPARDALSETNITGLTPGTKYGIWLELYLTNGRTKTSNVKDIMTKPGKPIPEDVQKYEGKVLEASPHRGDYYSSLVVVAILAALGAMCSLVLLLVLVRRHRTASAPICGPTSASRTSPALPPYDSPTYKLDLHQETMDL